MDKNNKQEDLSWKVLHSEYLFRCPWLTVRRDAVELPNGHTIPDYYVLEYPDWVNTIALTDDDQFVMVRQYRHGLRYTGYELCAGVCEKGETPEQAARRELLEETGFGGGTWQSLMDISGNTSTTNNLTHCFLATGVSSRTSTTPKTCAPPCSAGRKFSGCSKADISSNHSWPPRFGNILPPAARCPSKPGTPYPAPLLHP